MGQRGSKICIPNDSQVGLAWFTRDQWLHLTQVVDNRNELDDTFEQWERNALAALYKLESQGHPVRKVMVDVETYLKWCRGRGHRVDGASRAEYVTALLRIADGSA
jgi:hypothetical protein